MFKSKSVARAASYFGTAAFCALMSFPALAQTAPAGAVVQIAPAGAVKKVVNGKFAAAVDNGWVIYQGFQGQPTLNFYDTDISGSFKLKTSGFGAGNVGLLFDAGGIVFGPCPIASGKKCETNSDTGLTGVGVGFGQATFGGAGGEAGGWVNDSALAAHLTNPNQLPGSIAGLAIDPTNGAFAVGWDANNPSGADHGILWKLDSAGKTYAPQAEIDLGTLGGLTSSALGISKNALYVAGMATTTAGAGKTHAVYALTSAASWTDIVSVAPGVSGIIKSRALAASNTGFIAGSATVKRLINGRMHSVDIGFVYDTNTTNTTFFEAPGYDVKPLKVLDDGRVVGNLELVAIGNAVKADHPFIASGTVVTDFGVMGGAYGCRVNRPNSLGELAGSCIPNATTPYGVGGTAFFIDAAHGGSYVDVNAAIHANSDANTSGLGPYHIGSVTSIDDAHEISVMAVKIINSNPNIAAFLASKPAYNP